MRRANCEATSFYVLGSVFSMMCCLKSASLTPVDCHATTAVNSSTTPIPTNTSRKLRITYQWFSAITSFLETPQIVMITFDDSVNHLNYQLYSSLFNDKRRNPNGCPIRGTLFVSHAWTDYSLVQNLYSDGHEIASHSVSDSHPKHNATKEDWEAEISAQREILSQYANISHSDIRGMRAPFLDIGGESQFEMLSNKGFLYDSSMTAAENNPPVWPYTLDHQMPHRCVMPPCPLKSYPGLWEVPLVHWDDPSGFRCAMADGCYTPRTSEEVYKMLMKNFMRHYESNRAPFGVFYHSSWFLKAHNSVGFNRFLDEILTRPDVWIITISQMIEWMKSPVPVTQLQKFDSWKCEKSATPKCMNPFQCDTKFQGGGRILRTCSPCPVNYPWVGYINDASKLNEILPT